MKTKEKSRFIQDLSGLWHYNKPSVVDFGFTVEQAAEEALKNKPEGASWFWFNDTPAAIYLNDDVKSLIHRWEVWRTAFQKYDSETFLKCLQGLPNRNKTDRGPTRPKIPLSVLSMIV